jgi:DNA (cytosine-5)-methyltransferase 1
VSKIRYIDLFAGMGGIRLGFSQACNKLGLSHECVFSSEIKPHAIDIYKYNFNENYIHGDITQVNAGDIPDFDYLLAGFPCQAFSTAGKQLGFDDIRGTLFFDVARILKEKKPKGFILENVDGFVTHDKECKSDEIGRTLSTILNTLKELNYKVTWKVLDSANFGVPQVRKRVFIIGHLITEPNLENFNFRKSQIGDILEQGLPTMTTDFIEQLLKNYNVDELKGKAIKDKRGGKDNIHSWDIAIKGEINNYQKIILERLLRERRKKHWAKVKGITWMDGMPLTYHEIASFCTDIPAEKLKNLLSDLEKKGYVKLEHPKDIMTIDGKSKRYPDTNKDKGYNIVTGKLSFEFNEILHPKDIANTLVATEVDRIGVVDGEGIRRLSDKECLRFFGFPDSYQSNIPNKKLYDLIGNTVVVPVVKEVALRLLQ